MSLFLEMMFLRLKVVRILKQKKDYIEYNGAVNYLSRARWGFSCTKEREEKLE